MKRGDESDPNTFEKLPQIESN
jgi:hypothetical protein